MNRQILFRGRKGNMWYFGDLQHDQDGNTFIAFHDNIEHVRRVKPVEPETVGQLIGLVDKNGKQIFEGDILSFANNYEPYFAKVIFTTEDVASCGCCYSAFEGSGFVGKVLPGSKYVYSCFAGAMSKAEIVGNIHDNPEFEMKGAQ